MQNTVHSKYYFPKMAMTTSALLQCNLVFLPWRANCLLPPSPSPPEILDWLSNLLSQWNTAAGMYWHVQVCVVKNPAASALVCWNAHWWHSLSESTSQAWEAQASWRDHMPTRSSVNSAEPQGHSPTAQPRSPDLYLHSHLTAAAWVMSTRGNPSAELRQPTELGDLNTLKLF